MATFLTIIYICWFINVLYENKRLMGDSIFLQKNKQKNNIFDHFANRLAILLSSPFSVTFMTSHLWVVEKTSEPRENLFYPHATVKFFTYPKPDSNLAVMWKPEKYIPLNRNAIGTAC